jgi:hypothetical protein
MLVCNGVVMRRSDWYGSAICADSIVGRAARDSDVGDHCYSRRVETRPVGDPGSSP